MTDIRQQLLAVFDVEHREHLQSMRSVLSAAAAGDEVDLYDVFRRAHTLKGAARAVDLTEVERLADRLETVLTQVVEAPGLLTNELNNALSVALDAIEGAVAAAVQGRPEPHLQDAIDLLDQVAASEGEPSAQPDMTGEEKGEPSALASQAPEPASPLPELRPKQVATPATGTKGTLPDTTPSEASASAAGPSVTAHSAAAAFLTVSTELVDEVANASYELTLAVQARQGIDQLYRGLEAELKQLERSWEQVRAERRSQAVDDRSKTFQAQLRAISRQLSSLNRRQRQASWSVGQAAAGLRDRIEHLALVPAETVFGGFARMVREIARAERYPVEFAMSGLDLQADISLLQALKDPIMHLLRNAISHGGEPQDVRRAQGKPEALHIALEVSASADQLHVRVLDDGRGLDFARIAEVAARRGLIAPAAFGRVDQEQLASLLLHPGFSTAPEVNDLAGRGIGLSVVHDAIQRLRGAFSLRPGNPWGTVAFLDVPLSASRQNLLIVEAEGMVFGLPSTAVSRVMRVRLEDVGSVGGQPIVEVRQGEEVEPVPLVPLASLMRGTPGMLPSEGGMVNVVLLQAGRRQHALAVDLLQEAGPFVIAAPELIGTDPSIIAGTAVLSDGSPAPVLRPEGLMAQWIERDKGRASLVDGWSGPEQPRQATILVVDDSITTRTLEKNLLEAQGFRVLVSVDGIDALAVLREQSDIDLVVADIEMPRMDGLALLRAMKNDARLEAIPVILMTSRAGAEDVRRGLELGAEAYLTKQKFDQRELLATINQLL
ncbi:hybrid sensor histidine kinase/response regulator [Rhodoligotrophos ferricapiens]|uniref:hybrid sensor histidine kinase/response regulator n=1 Tax=Rhodoligotrophos ferricapiens TaxID=3069264 RepID=UPI00315DD0C0